MRLWGFLLFIPSLLFAAIVVETFDAPDTGITGLAYGDGSLWAIDGTTQNVYEVDPDDGSVLSTFYVMDQTPTYNPVTSGLAYGNSTVYVPIYSGSQYGKFYKYDATGTYLGMFDAYC